MPRLYGVDDDAVGVERVLPVVGRGVTAGVPATAVVGVDGAPLVPEADDVTV